MTNKRRPSAQDPAGERELERLTGVRSAPPEEGGRLTEKGDRLTERHEIGALMLLDMLSEFMEPLTSLVEFPSSGLEFRLELHDPSDSLEVHSLLGELGDSAQDVDVVVAVSTVAPVGARRLDEAASLVDAEHLGMHTGQLGGHRDDVHGLVSAPHGHGCSPPSSFAPVASTLVAAARASIAARSASLSSVGTITLTVA